MKVRASHVRRLAGLALSAGLVAVTAHAPAGPDPQAIGHSRVSVHRNDDGSIRRGLHNEVETSNWSGYAVANYASGTLYTSVQATWTVPKVSYQSPPPVCHTVTFGRRTQQECTSATPSAEYSASWVGIGGFCENASCSSVDNTLIQLGTEQDVSSRGVTDYYAWIETLPEAEEPICSGGRMKCSYPVEPGDSITATLTCESNCSSPGATQSWRLSLADATEDWTYSTTVNYASTLLSAEWIQEAPSSSGGVLALADYGTATFTHTGGFAGTSGVTLASNGIVMVDPYGETSVPSSPDPADDFSACWGNNSSLLSSCAAP